MWYIFDLSLHIKVLVVNKSSVFTLSLFPLKHNHKIPEDQHIQTKITVILIKGLYEQKNYINEESYIEHQDKNSSVINFNEIKCNFQH